MSKLLEQIEIVNDTLGSLATVTLNNIQNETEDTLYMISVLSLVDNHVWESEIYDSIESATEVYNTVCEICQSRANSFENEGEIE